MYHDGQKPKINTPLGHLENLGSTTSGELAHRGRRIEIGRNARKVLEQPQLTRAISTIDVRNARPVDAELELVASKIRSRSTLEPRQRPVAELNQSREDLACSEIYIGLSPELIRGNALAMLGVELDPRRTCVLQGVLHESQMTLATLEVCPPPGGVALGSNDSAPQLVERARNMQQQDTGRALRHEVCGRVGQLNARPQLARLLHLLLRRTPPRRRHELVPLQPDELFDTGHKTLSFHAVGFLRCVAAVISTELRTACYRQILPAKRHSQLWRHT